MSGINENVTDSITTVNTMTVALAPAMAMGSVYQTLANSTGMAATNLTFAIQQAQSNYQTATTMGVKKLLS